MTKQKLLIYDISQQPVLVQNYNGCTHLLFKYDGVTLLDVCRDEQSAREVARVKYGRACEAPQ